ncbi:MAG: hypothetical protein IPM21_09680 [Acidobacteria bacterium]|nr:hypothetical protein [Acidobacteriota bacterium]
MKYTLLLTVFVIVLLLACQSPILNSKEFPSNISIKSEDEKSSRSANGNEEIWIPTEIEECISKVDVGEPFNFETDFNPFYLRADFDGNKHMDYAILVKGQTTRKRGVVVCKDAQRPFLFAALAKSKLSVSSFDDDNFITNQWEISSKEETRSQVNILGNKISPNAKGESITFIFEGGTGVHIYWNGKEFMIGE